MPLPSLSHKRILQLVPSLNSGGVERTVLEIAQAILEAGGQAYVATQGGRLVEPLEKMGARVFLVPLHSKNPFKMLYNSFVLKKICKEEKIDLIHARSRAPAWSGYYAAQALDLPFITTYHGIYSGGRGFKEYYNRIMVKGQVTIANSSFTKDHILKTHKVSDIRVINRGVDLSYFVPQAPPQNDLFTFLMPARIARGKGFETLFKALPLLTTPCRVLIVGDGRDTRFGRTLHPPKNVTFLGHVQDMRTAYAQCDAVLIPATRPEAFGRIAIEAGAMGKIALASKIGGMIETIQHEKTGFHCEAGNPQALATSMEHLLHLPEHTRHALEKAAHEFISTHYSLAQMQEKTLQIYAEILK